MQVKLADTGQLFPLQREEAGHFGGVIEGLACIGQKLAHLIHEETGIDARKLLGIPMEVGQ